MFVPHYAMSGGTLLALAADEIVMDPNAVLGPVDPQIGAVAGRLDPEGARAKKPEDVDDQTLILADMARKALAQVRRTVQDPDASGMDRGAGGGAGRDAGDGHGDARLPDQFEEAKALGLPVSTEMPEEVYELMSLFRSRRAGGRRVKYVPMPYRGARPHRSSTGS